MRRIFVDFFKTLEMEKIASFMLVLCCTACLDISGSKNTTLVEVFSPSHKKKAILFIKNTGTTSDNSLQVSLLTERIALKETEVGNVFTTDSDHGKVQLDSTVIQLIWKNEDTLTIKYDRKLRTFIQNQTLLNTTINYDSIETPQ